MLHILACDIGCMRVSRVLGVVAGVEHGMQLAVGEVNSGGRDKNITELYVSVVVEPHPVFRRAGANVVVNSNLDMVDAALGTEIMCVRPFRSFSKFSFHHCLVYVQQKTTGAECSRLLQALTYCLLHVSLRFFPES